jgi:Arm DNA-binding domain
MRSSNTFGIQFILRPNQKGTHTMYARIVVNSTRCELGLKQAIDKNDWNSAKGAAKPKTHELKKLNNYLEEVRAKLVSITGSSIFPVSGSPPKPSKTPTWAETMPARKKCP